jgi:hypothetical protein
VRAVLAAGLRDRRAVMSDLLKLLLHDTVNSNPLDFAAPTVSVTVSVTASRQDQASSPNQ